MLLCMFGFVSLAEVGRCFAQCDILRPYNIPKIALCNTRFNPKPLCEYSHAHTTILGHYLSTNPSQSFNT